jgi:hypothetical protein
VNDGLPLQRALVVSQLGRSLGGWQQTEYIFLVEVANSKMSKSLLFCLTFLAPLLPN